MLECRVADAVAGLLARQLAELENKHLSYDIALLWWNDGKEGEPDAAMRKHLKVYKEYNERAEGFLDGLGFQKLWSMTDEVRDILRNARQRGLLQ